MILTAMDSHTHSAMLLCPLTSRPQRLNSSASANWVKTISSPPLLQEDDSLLVGLHSSWDNDIWIRHGVPLVAIKHFADQHTAIFF